MSFNQGYLLWVYCSYTNFCAESCIGNGISGSPLTQVLVYALLFNCPKKIDIEIVQLLCDTSFDIHIACCDSFYSPIALAISLNRLDIAKLLVKTGAHPIDPCIPTCQRVVGIIQLLQEYYKFGTNHYIRWLLHQYLLSSDLPVFIDTVTNLDILNEVTMSMFSDVGRHPAHAILTCGNGEMIRKFVVRHGSSLLIVKDENGKSALQLAAETGDLESVEALMKVYVCT